MVQPELLYEEVIELAERVRVITTASGRVVDERHERRTAITGEQVEILQPLDVASLTHELQKVYDKGIV